MVRTSRGRADRGIPRGDVDCLHSGDAAVYDSGGLYRTFCPSGGSGPSPGSCAVQGDEEAKADSKS